ncbi:MAG: carboxypeptidase-like regulatory domain-containing protein [Bacteroidales bacterium]|jgi:putative lipoprotein (rSAM/lipoprotein system)|nr:carboxypeptidase-like regulatory domain-containing protein [Bacteroidales bacterium]
MTKNWIRRLIGGLSFTTALFAFQACYGTPGDGWDDVYIHGTVKSKSSGEPIENIQIKINNEGYISTKENGQFSFYTSFNESLPISFEDIDSLENGYFYSKDTVIKALKSEILLEIFLDEKTIQE